MHVNYFSVIYFFNIEGRELASSIRNNIVTGKVSRVNVEAILRAISL